MSRIDHLLAAMTVARCCRAGRAGRSGHAARIGRSRTGGAAAAGAEQPAIGCQCRPAGPGGRARPRAGAAFSIPVTPMPAGRVPAGALRTTRGALWRRHGNPTRKDTTCESFPRMPATPLPAAMHPCVACRRSGCCHLDLPQRRHKLRRQRRPSWRRAPLPRLPLRRLQGQRPLQRPRRPTPLSRRRLPKYRLPRHPLRHRWWTRSRRRLRTRRLRPFPPAAAAPVAAPPTVVESASRRSAGTACIGHRAVAARAGDRACARCPLPGGSGRRLATQGDLLIGACQGHDAGASGRAAGRAARAGHPPAARSGASVRCGRRPGSRPCRLCQRRTSSCGWATSGCARWKGATPTATFYLVSAPGSPAATRSPTVMSTCAEPVRVHG